MKRATYILIALMALTLLVGAEPVKPAAAAQDGIRVYFSPDGGADDAVVGEIQKAKRTLDVAAYSYTNTEIAKATADAHRRGVKVRVILDRSQSTGQYSSATYLANAGVPVFIYRGAGLQHNKYLLIDGATLITGSFNLTKSAEETNAENLLVIDGKTKLNAAYLENFAGLFKKSEPYSR